MPMAILRNQPNVHASDSCAAGITTSATFSPGEISDTRGTGMVDSLGTASASARNPASKPAIAGNTKRKKMRFGISRHSIRPRVASSQGPPPVDEWVTLRSLSTPMKRFRSTAHYAFSKTNPNSNASVLINGGTVVPGASRGGSWSGDAWGALLGELCSSRVVRQYVPLACLP